MKRFSIIAWVPLHPYLALLLSLAFFSFFAFHIPNAKLMNNVDYFTVDNDDSRYFREFKKIFPKSEFFTVTFQKKDIFERMTRFA